MAVPIRKAKKDGTLYQRRPEIEAKLDALTTLSRSELAKQKWAAAWSTFRS